MPGLNNGMGGFNYDAITTVLDRWAKPEQYQILFDRALIVVRAITDHRKDEREKEEMKK